MSINLAKILIAEDSQDLLEFFQYLLEKHNHIIQSARTRAQILQMVEVFQPDLILMDIILSDTDGRLLCREIKQSHQMIKIILMSASYKLLDNFSAFGADAAMEKPFNIRDILSQINVLIPS